MTTVCTAPYATGQCLNSSHSTSRVEPASSMRCGLSGTPATPRHRSTPACPVPPGRPCWPPCAPPESSASDGEHHVLPGGLPVEEGDALVVATSGSSGQPKGVVLTHDALRASARATSDRLGVDPARHTWLACLPLAHVGGLSWSPGPC